MKEMKEMTEVTNKINLIKYMQCNKQGHEAEPMSRICIDVKCSNRALVCAICQLQKHKTHETIPLKTFLLKCYQQSVNKNLIQNNQNFNPLYFENLIQHSKASFLGCITQFRLDIDQMLEKLETKAHVYFSNMMQKMLLFFNFQNPLKILNRQGLSHSTTIKYLSDMAKQLIISQKNEIDCNFTSLIKTSKEKQKKLNNALTKTKGVINEMVANLQKMLNPPFDHAFQKTEFTWGQQLKGNNIKINGEIAEQTGVQTNGQRFALLEPSLNQLHDSKVNWGVKVLKFAGWIGVGISLKNVVKQANFYFNYNTIGHGSYMISNNGYSWSHSSVNFHSTNKAFPFKLGDIIYLQFDRKNKKLRFMKNLSSQKFQLEFIDPPPGDSYHPCVNLCVAGDTVEIINSGIPLS